MQCSVQSTSNFLRQNFLNHIDIKPENINALDGSIPKDELESYCQEYENKIRKNGGIDIMILGLGKAGQLGLNEPNNSVKSVTRLVTLDRSARTEAASQFYDIQNVPKHGLTMGLQTILTSKQIYLVAFSEGQSKLIHQIIEEPVNKKIPASHLQNHQNTKCVIDQSTAESLSQFQEPWKLLQVNTLPDFSFNNYWATKAVIWLSQTVQKPILRLTSEDYEDNHLLQLLKDFSSNTNSASFINQKVFSNLNKVITEKPAGDCKESKNILIFSPHPDDDVICMSGTILKFLKDQHNVYTVYQTSGNIAVFDHDALRMNDFVKEFNIHLGGKNLEVAAQCEQVINVIQNKVPDQEEDEKVLKTKTLIRRTEARDAAMALGVPYNNIYSLDLPFYESGKVNKNPLSKKDIDIVKGIIMKVRPQQIYAAGDLTDPHGTHRVCLKAVIEALEVIKEVNIFTHYNQEELFNIEEESVYLYRGAWQEWKLEDTTVIVPLNPDEVQKKKLAIFKHQSQKDVIMFPGADKREFWERAQERNKQTAQQISELGLNSYEAVECFVTLKWLKSYSGYERARVN